MPPLALPDMSLVVLVGASGSGKSTFAAQHFGPFETLSSDWFRGLVSNDENDRPVAPGPPENSVSPVKTVPSSGTCRQVEPGEWPGVVIACSSIPPAVSTSPSQRSWSGLRSGCAIAQSGASAGCR